MYNIFMISNMTIPESIAELFQTLAAPARVAILIAIGRGESCVCHLEAILGLRQATLSQHLMALRKAGLLQDRKAGRYVYYSLRHPALLDLLKSAAHFSGTDADQVEKMANPNPGPNCECPSCLPAFITLEELPHR